MVGQAAPLHAAEHQHAACMDEAHPRHHLLCSCSWHKPRREPLTQLLLERGLQVLQAARHLLQRWNLRLHTAAAASHCVNSSAEKNCSNHTSTSVSLNLSPAGGLAVPVHLTTSG